jgi:CheY-like chemotaxis protein
VLSAAVDSSLPLIEAARHRFELRLPTEPLALYADPTRLTQVVSNLLNNASRYTPRGGAIVLAAERDGREAVITVSDDGIGIAADALERVFQMFTQVGAKGAQGGLGIGLSLVRSLVELHGGSVTAASPGLGAGSSFTVRLPLEARDAPPRPLAQPGTAAPQEAAGSRRILVVDDNRDAAETLAALLSSMGHTAAVANDGYQALRMLAGFAGGLPRPGHAGPVRLRGGHGSAQGSPQRRRAAGCPDRLGRRGRPRAQRPRRIRLPPHQAGHARRRPGGARARRVRYHDSVSSRLAMRGQHSWLTSSRAAQRNPSISGVGLPVAWCGK